MAFWRALNFCLGRVLEPWEKTIPGSAQRLRVEAKVLDHFQRHRQTTTHALEAGGQLFGRIEPECVAIVAATGPQRSDERSRHGFRSDPYLAQRGIDKLARQGLTYLGEWHTHAERHPQPSASDLLAMKKIVAHSKLNSTCLLMLIVGNGEPVDDLGAWYVDATGTLQKIS